MDAPRSITDLALGESAVVARVAGDRPVVVRLMEMGLIPGTQVTLVRRAPMGDPLELRLRGYALSIRAREASKVEIVAGASAP